MSAFQIVYSRIWIAAVVAGLGGRVGNEPRFLCAAFRPRMNPGAIKCMFAKTAVKNATRFSRQIIHIRTSV